MSSVLAVDVGGTKLAAAVVTECGDFLARYEVATPPSADAEVVAAALREVAGTVVDRLGGDKPVAVGVGSAGPLDPLAGTVSPVNIPAWRDFPILAALADVLPDRPAKLAGDGHCMALGEYRFGGYRSGALLGIVVSTGVGGGVVVDGQVVPGPTGNAGHIGHIPVDPRGPACPCGGRGCVEVLASGPAMVGWAQQQGWAPVAGTSRSGTGNAGADARALAYSARAGNPIACAAFARGARALGTAVVSAAALFDLDDVVIGGGVARAGEPLFDPLLATIADLAGLAFVRRVRVHESQLGAAAGLLGAAAIAFDCAAVHTSTGGCA